MSKISPSGKQLEDELDRMIEDIWNTAKASKKPRCQTGGAMHDMQFFTPDTVVAISERGLTSYWITLEGKILSEDVLEQVPFRDLYRAYQAGPNHIICLTGHATKVVHVYNLDGTLAMPPIEGLQDGDLIMYTSAFVINRERSADIHPFDPKFQRLEYKERLQQPSTSDIIEFQGHLLLALMTGNELTIIDLLTETKIETIFSGEHIEHLITHVSDTRIDFVLSLENECMFYHRFFKDGDSWNSTFIKEYNYSRPEFGGLKSITIFDKDKLAILYQDTSLAIYNLNQLLCDPEIVPEVFPNCKKVIISKNGTMAAEQDGIRMKKMQRFHWKQTVALSVDQEEIPKEIEKMHLTIPKALSDSDPTLKSKVIVSGYNLRHEPRLWIWTVDEENTMSNPIVLTADADERISFEVSLANENLILCILYNRNRVEADMIPLDFTEWEMYGCNKVSTSDTRSLCFFPATLTVATISDRLFIARLGELKASRQLIKLPNEETPTMCCEGESYWESHREYGKNIQEVFVSCYDPNGEERTKHAIIAVKLTMAHFKAYHDKMPSDYKERLENGSTVALREFNDEAEVVQANQNKEDGTADHTKYEYMHGHTAEINYMCISKNRNYLISSSVNREVIVWQLWEGYRIQLHKVICPTYIQLFEDSFYSIESPMPRERTQEEIDAEEEAYPVGVPHLDDSIPEKLIVTERYLIVLTQKHFLTVWDLKTRACVGSQSQVETIEYSEVNGKVNFWYRKIGDEEFRVDSRPHKTLFGCKADRCNDPGLVRTLLTLSLRRPIKYTPNMNSVILRHSFGVLHLYAYLNMSGHFSKALNDGAPLTIGHHGYNALNILIKYKRKEMIESLFAYLIVNARSNKFCGHLFDVESLNELSQLVPHLLPTLFTSFFVNIPRNGLPILAATHSKLPVTKSFPNLSEMLDFRTELGQIGDSDKSRNQIIQYKQFLFPINSDDLAISLLDYPDQTIFANPVVTLVLDYRWRHTQWFAVTQAAIYFVFLTLVTLHALLLPNSIGMLFTLLVLAILFLIYEGAMYFNSKRAYIKDRWNYLDVIVSTVYLVYFLVALLVSDDDTIRVFLAIFMICAYLRGVNYFSSIDKTRYMTFLLEQVVEDIIPFTILVLYVMVSFAALFSLDDYNGEDGYLHNYISFLYRLGLGDFDTEDYGNLRMVLFFGSSFFLSIMMLNLLISILGDSFDNVQDNRVSADNIKRTTLILEYDSFKKLPGIQKCFKKKEGKKVYIARCTKDDKFIVEKWEGWQQNLKKEMHKATQQAVKETTKTQREVRELREEVNNITTSIKQIKRALNIPE